MEYLLPIIIAVIGSQSLVELIKWLTTRKKPKPTDKLLCAIAQDRIVYLGSAYIAQGYITREQLTILTNLITPYKELDWDGVADTIFERCQHLPLKEDSL